MLKMILSVFVLVNFGFSLPSMADVDPQLKQKCDIVGGEIERDNADLEYSCSKDISNVNISVSTSQTAARKSSLNPSGLGENCRTKTESALEGCNFDSNPAVKTVMGMANGYKQQLEAGAASSQANLCSKMGTLAQAINGAVAAYSTYCSSGYANCQSACEDDSKAAKEMLANPNAKPMEEQINDKLAEIRANQRKCAGLASNLQNVQQSITSYTQIEQMKSQFCGQAVTTTDCKANPANSACQQKLTQDCSDPAYAATATVCICMKNPADSRCGSGSNSNFLNGSNKIGAGSGGGADGKAGSGDFGGLNGGGMGSLNDIDPMTGKPSDGNGTNLAKGGAGRANLDVGGGGNPGGGKGGPAGAGGSGINTKIIGGYGFGNGGGGGYGSGSGSGGAAGSGYGAQRGGVGPNGQNVDLRQFMPGGKMDPSRALAGVSGPDGITGPNTDIWQKIRVRYFSVSPSLLP